MYCRMIKVFAVLLAIIMFVGSISAVAEAVGDGSSNDAVAAGDHVCIAGCKNPTACATCGGTPTTSVLKHNTGDKERVPLPGMKGYHGYECVDCKQFFGTAACYPSCKQPGVCAVCGQECFSAVEHNPGGEWYGTFMNYPLDITKHCHLCVDCGEYYGIESHTIPCNATGLMKDMCIVCYARVPDLQPIHNTSDQTWYVHPADFSFHTQKCVDCGEILLTENHSFTNGICTACGVREDMSEFVIANGTLYAYIGTGAAVVIPSSVTAISRNAFSGNSVVATVTIPVSVQSIDGSAFSGCDNLTVKLYENSCAHSYCEENNIKYELISGSCEHVWGEWNVIIYAECIGEGSQVRSCSICGATETEIIPAYGHDEGIYVGIPATCTESGWTEGVQCTFCGMFLSEVVEIPPLGHTEETLPGYPATETSTGLTDGKKCIICGEITVSQQVIPRLNPENDYQYTVENGEVVITGYIGIDTEITIPSTLGGYPVTGIGDFAFMDCSDLTSVVIGDSVNSIGESAFNGCNSLTSVMIGNGTQSIGRGAFCECSSLISIDIPNSVTTMGDSVFLFCSNLERVSIGNNVQSIGNSVFAHCSSLTSINVPDSVTTIGDSAFLFCSNLANVTIGDSVQSIGGSAFCQCSSITNLSIPDSVTSIGQLAFSSCSSLVSMVLPNGITSIGPSVFQDCSNLANVTIPDGVTNIGIYAFLRCNSLPSVTIPKNVVSIGYGAFDNCPFLTANVYENSVAHTYCVDNSIPYVLVDESVASGSCGHDVAWELDEEGVLWLSGTGAMYDYSAASPAPWHDYCGDITTVIIGDGITALGSYAFSGCNALMKVSLPNGLESIADFCFQSCTSLENIDIPASVTSIGSYAFADCSAVTNVTLGGSVLVSKTYSLRNRSRQMNIGDYAFSGCSRLTEAIVLAKDASFGDNVFSNCPKLETVYLYRDSGADDYLASNYQGMTRKFIADSDSPYSFTLSNDTAVVSGYSGNDAEIVIPAVYYDGGTLYNVTAIADNADLGNVNMIYVEKEISVPEEIDVPVISYKDEKGKVSITSGDNLRGEVTIPASIGGKAVREVAANAFANETGLTGITVQDSNTSIGNAAFPSNVKVTYSDCQNNNHKFIDYTYNGNASCTADGTETAYCVRGCGKTHTRTAQGSAKGHLFSDYIPDNNASCTEDGTKTAYCLRDGCRAKVIMIIRGSALGHDFQPDPDKSRPAGCITPGLEAGSCIRCGETSYKATAPLGHVEEIIPAVAPSCSETGLTEGVKCAACGEIIKEPETAAMIPHEIVDVEMVVPSCSATGLTAGSACAVCGKVFVAQEVIPMLPHTPVEIPSVEPTYTKPGKTAGTECAVCGALLSGCEEIGVLTPKLAGLALMRKGASQQAEMYFPLLQPSQSFSIIGEMENRFYPIMLANGVTGYLHVSYLVGGMDINFAA